MTMGKSLTTHNLPPTKPVELKEMVPITTGTTSTVSPKAEPPAPEAGLLTKMISTQDEPKAAPGTPFQRDVENMGKDSDVEDAKPKYVHPAKPPIGVKPVHKHAKK